MLAVCKSQAHACKSSSQNYTLLQWNEEQAKEEAGRTLLLANLTVPDKPIIIIATATMLDWARLCGHNRPLSIDCTFGLNKYGFSVCTLTALNGRGRGVPICVAVIGSESGDTFATILTELKKHLPDNWRPSIVLADAAEAEHNGVWCVLLLLPHDVSARFWYWPTSRQPQSRFCTCRTFNTWKWVNSQLCIC